MASRGSREHPTIEASTTQAPRRTPIAVVLDAVLDGDLVAALHAVEAAGGPGAFADDTGLIRALLAERALGLELADAHEIARAIAADVDAPPASEPAAAARALLSRLVGALGLTSRMRLSGDPVIVDLGHAAATRATLGAPPPPNLGAATAGVAPLAAARPAPPAEVGIIPGPPPGLVRAPLVPLVRGAFKNVFSAESWRARVDTIAIAIAPMVQPGVYALQRRALPGAAGGARGAGAELDAAAIRTRLGAGRPLPAEVQAALTRQLAALGRAVDLGAVRVHDGAEADALCVALEAEAFALGTDVAFRAGAFRPESSEGLQLLVHELTHVWQQAHGEVEPGLDTSPGLEAEAEWLADRVVAGRANGAEVGGESEVGFEIEIESEAEIVSEAEVEVEVGFESDFESGFESGSETDFDAGPSPDGDALQLCGPRAMAARAHPPRGRNDPHRDDPIVDPIPPQVDPVPPEPEPEPGPAAECDACPEPDLSHVIEPLRQLPTKPPTPGQKVVELSLGGRKIKVEVPEAQADGEVEVTFRENPSPFAALVFKKAKLRFDGSLRVLGGEITCMVSLGAYIHVDNTILRVFEDGRIGAEIRGLQINVADNLRATIDLVVGPEGVWGVCTATAESLIVSDLVTVKSGLVHVRVEKNGSVNAHGAITVEVRGVGEATLEACYVDGKWGGRITLARREELVLAPGVVLEEIELTGCFKPDEWWVYGAAKVRLFDKFRITADAKYHWKRGEGKWSFEGELTQFESVPLGADVELQNVHAHAKFEEGVWEPLTFSADLHHPWVLGQIIDGVWNIEENLWSGTGHVELLKPLPIGETGATLDQVDVTVFMVDNELTELHGKTHATFPLQGEPTFTFDCQDAVYKFKEDTFFATGDLRTCRPLTFGDEAGFHAVINEGAGVTALIAESKLQKTLGGLAFEARHGVRVLGDGGFYINWTPDGGINAGGRFELRERFGLPDIAAGPLFMLPGGLFEFLVENSQPKHMKAVAVGFEIAQGGEGATGLIGGEVSGAFDFDTNLADLSGTAKVVRSWSEPLGDFGTVTFVESETPNLTVAIEKSELTEASGSLDVRFDVNATEHVQAFSLLGHVDGRYNPKTGKVSGEVGAQLETNLDVALSNGDRVVITAGAWFTTTMTENVLETFDVALVVQYYRQDELFLEGACEEGSFDFRTGEIDFVGRLTLKKDIVKALGETGYSLALVKDLTQLEVEVRKSELLKVGGDVAVQLRDAEGPLLEGMLLNADYRIQEELFTGELDLSLRRNLAWPKAADQAALPPTLQVELSRGSHVHGHIQDNVFTEASCELIGRVHYKGKEQAEAFLHGRWNLVADTYDLDGYFRLTEDLVLGASSAADAKAISDWTLVFEKDSEVTVAVVANHFQQATIAVAMQLRRGEETCVTGGLGGQYLFGDEAGFTGGGHFDVIKEISLGKVGAGGRFEMLLGTDTGGQIQLAQSAVTSGNIDVALLAREGAFDKASLTLNVAYAGGSEFSGNAQFAVLDPIRVGTRKMGKDTFAMELNTKTHADIGVVANAPTAFHGGVGLDVLRNEQRFAEGDLEIAYDFRTPDAGIRASGEIRLLQALELGTVGAYTFSLEGGTGLRAAIENSGLASLDGAMKLGVATQKEGQFAFLDITTSYRGGEKPDISGTAIATVVKEHDLGTKEGKYSFLLQPSSGFRIEVLQSDFKEFHGDIGLIARQRTKTKDGMNGDVRMTLHGDAVKTDKWDIGGTATAVVEGNIRVGTAGDYVFWLETGSGVNLVVAHNKFVSIEGTLNGRVTEKDKGFLGFHCWVHYDAPTSDTDPGFVSANGNCKLLGEKKLYDKNGFTFSLMPTAGYTAQILVERNVVKEVGGTMGFRLANTNAKPQPLKVVGSASGHYNNDTGMFSGSGDIRLESDLEFAMGKNKIILEKGSGGMTSVENNELQRLGGTLIGRFDDADGPLVRLRAAGDFNARTPELERLEGSATLLRELKLGPDGNPWIIVEKDLSCDVRMAHNTLTYASGKNGKFRVPALRLKGGFDHITMNAEGPKTKYSGAGFLEMEMLKEDKEKGRKLKGRLDIDYREDDTWNARGTVDYNITPYLGGQLTAEVDQTLDPILGGTLVMQKKEMMAGRDLFETQFPIIPDVSIPIAGIAGVGFGARGYFGLAMLPMNLSASVGIANFRPRQMNVPDFEAEADVDWGLRLKAGAMAYLDVHLSVLVASAAIGIKGTADLAGDALVKAKGKIAGKQGKYSGELGVGLSFAPTVTLRASPYAEASLFSSTWTKSWDAYTYDLGEVFRYDWGSTYKFGDQPERPTENSERQDANVSGGSRQSMEQVNDKAAADAFGEERATPAAAATEGRPQMESGEELKNKKEEDDKADMEGLEKDGKDASDIGSVMAAVGNIVSQLGQILGSLTFGPIGLVLCLAWKWLSGALKKLYDDWCLVTDYISNNWDKIKEYLPDWFTGFVDFMSDPASAAEKWWNADEYARQAVQAGDHVNAAAEVRGNIVSNLFGGYCGEPDRRAIEEVFQVSLNKGDLRAVLTASEYTEHSYGASWWRHSDWDGSRLQRIFEAAGYRVSPGYATGLLLDADETTSGTRDPAAAHAAAASGVSGGSSAMPFQGEIQSSFGHHDVSGIEAHTGSAAAAASDTLGANAYATGNHVAFGGAPDLHTAAHEAAHVVQQQSGVSLSGGIGESGDAYEVHADAVADQVVAGESAEALLDGKAGAETTATAGAGAVQKKEGEKPPAGDHGKTEGPSTEAGAEDAAPEDTIDFEALANALDRFDQRRRDAATQLSALLARGSVVHPAPEVATLGTGIPRALTWTEDLIATWAARPDLPSDQLLQMFNRGAQDVPAAIEALDTYVPQRVANVVGLPLAGTKLHDAAVGGAAEAFSGAATGAGYTPTLASDVAPAALEQTFLTGHAVLAEGDELVVFVAGVRDGDALLAPDGAGGLDWVALRQAAGLTALAAQAGIRASVVLDPRAADPKALEALHQGSGLTPEFFEIAQALTEREATERLHATQRDALASRGDDTMRTRAVAPARIGGDFAERLLAYRRVNPGTSAREAVRAFVATFGDAPPDLGNVAATTEAVRGTGQTRRASTFHANPKDTSALSPGLHQLAYDVAGFAEAMGFASTAHVPGSKTQFLDALAAGIGLRAGDDIFVFFTGHWYSDGIIMASATGYSEQVPYGEIRGVLARAEARGVHFMVALDLRDGAAETSEASAETTPTAGTTEANAEPLAPSLIEAGGYLDALDRADRMAAADREKLAREGSETFMTVSSATEAIQDADNLADRLLRFRALHPTMPLNELLAAFQVATLDLKDDPQFVRIGEGLANVARTRRALVFTANPKDTATLANLDKQADGLAEMFSAMGFATQKWTRNTALQMRTEFARIWDGLQPGDEVAVFFGGHGDAAGVLADSAEGYSEVIPYGVLRGLTADGHGRGIHVTVILDTCFGGNVIAAKADAGTNAGADPTTGGAAPDGISKEVAENAKTLGALPVLANKQFAASEGTAIAGGHRTSLVMANHAGQFGWPSASAHGAQMAGALRSLGFEVEFVENARATEMRTQIREATMGAKSGDDVAIYFAGRLAGSDLVGLEGAPLSTAILHGALAQAGARAFRASVMVEPFAADATTDGAPAEGFDLSGASAAAHLPSVAQQPGDEHDVIAAIGAIEVIRHSIGKVEPEEAKRLEAEYRHQVQAIAHLRQAHQNAGTQTGPGRMTVVGGAATAMGDENSFIRCALDAQAQYGLDVEGSLDYAMRHFANKDGSNGAMIERAGNEGRVKKALIVACNPKDSSALDGAWKDALALEAALESERYEVDFHADVSARFVADKAHALARSLQPGELGLFSFSGHGNAQGMLCSSPTGYTDILEMAELRGIFAAAQARGAEVRIIIDTCYSAEMATELAGDGAAEVDGAKSGTEADNDAKAAGSVLPMDELTLAAPLVAIPWGRGLRRFAFELDVEVARIAPVVPGDDTNRPAAEALVGALEPHLFFVAREALISVITPTPPGKKIETPFDRVALMAGLVPLASKHWSIVAITKILGVRASGADGDLHDTIVPVTSGAALFSSSSHQANDGGGGSFNVETGRYSGRLLDSLVHSDDDGSDLTAHGERAKNDKNSVEQSPSTFVLAPITRLGTDDGKPPDRRSVHVGTNAPWTTPLPGALGDASVFTSVMRERGFDARTLVDTTAGEIRRAYNAALAGLGQDDHLVLSFSGHGAPEQNRGVYAMDSRGGEGPYYYWSEFADLIVKATARNIHIQVVVDACYATNAQNHLQQRLDNSGPARGRAAERHASAWRLGQLASEVAAHAAAVAPTKPQPVWLRQLGELATGYAALANAPSGATPEAIARDPLGAARTLVAECQVLGAETQRAMDEEASLANLVARSRAIQAAQTESARPERETHSVLGEPLNERADGTSGATDIEAKTPDTRPVADVPYTAKYKWKDGPVQKRAGGDGAASGADAPDVQHTAQAGVAGGGGAMPYGTEIQAAFGAHDVGDVQAHVGGEAATAADAIGASAYATGNHVAFGGAPDLHTAAHEAAHVVQQRAGVSLAGGVGAAGDSYEQHADAVADAVVAGQSAEGLLDAKAGRAGASDAGAQATQAVQRKELSPEVVTADKTDTRDAPEHPATTQPQGLDPELTTLWGGVEQLATALKSYLGAVPQALITAEGVKVELETLIAREAQTAPPTTGAPPVESAERAALVARFRLACDTARTALMTAAASEANALILQLRDHEGPLTILVNRGKLATGLSGQGSKDLAKLVEKFEALKALFATHITALKGMGSTGTGTAAVGDAPATQRTTLVAEIPALETAVETALDTYEGVVAGLQEVADSQKGFDRHGAPEVDKQLASALTWQRKQGILPAALVPFSDAAPLIDIVAMVPTLRAAFVRAVIMTSAGSLHDGTLDPEAMAASIGPAKRLVEEIKAAPDDDARLEAIRGYLRQWGKNPVALSEARQNPALAAAMVGMESAALALGNEMLASGKVLILEDVDGVHKGQSLKEEGEAGLVDADLGTALSMNVLGAKQEDFLAGPLKSRIKGLLDSIKQTQSNGLPIKADDQTQLDSLVKRCGTDQRIIARIAKQDRGFFDDVFAALIALDTSGLPKEGDSAAATTCPTVTELATAIATKQDATTVLAKWETAKRKDNRGAQAAATALREAFPKVGGYLTRALADLLGTPEKLLQAQHGDATKAGLDAKLVAMIGELGFGLSELLVAVNGSAKALDVTEHGPASNQADPEADALAKEHGTLVEVAKALAKKLDPAIITRACGAPPVKRKVDYVLDRFEEQTGKNLYAHSIYKGASRADKDAFAAAIGATADAGSQAYLSDVSELETGAAIIHGIGITRISAIADDLDLAMAKAAKIFAALATVTDRVHEAVAPNGRLPATPQQVFLNVYAFQTGVDFFSALRTKLNQWVAWVTAGVADIRASIDKDGEKLKATIQKHFGFTLEHLGSADERGVTIEAGAEAQSKILGTTTPQIVKPDMKVREGFDDLMAYRIAENFYAVLNSDARTAGFLEDKAGETHAGDIVNLKVLSGSQKALIGTLTANNRASQLTVALASLPVAERTCIDEAFRLRFGKTLAAEFAKQGLSKETSNTMKLDAADPHAELKDDVRRALGAKAKERVHELVLSASAEQRAALLGDGELVHMLKQGCATPAAWDELYGILTGKVDLAGMLAQRQGILDDDEVGADKDIATSIKVLLAELQTKYPAAFDATHPQHAAYQTRYQAELRGRLLATATDDKVLKVAGRFMNDEELRHLQAMILGGGAESGKEKLLRAYRDTLFWARDKAALVAAIKGMSADERAAAAKDPEVREAIAKSLGTEEQRLVFGLLEGDANAELVATFDGKWWLRLDVEAIFTTLEGLGFAAWSALRQDTEAIAELASKLGTHNVARLQQLLKLNPLNLPEGKAYVSGPSAADKNEAQRNFHLHILKQRLMTAADKGAGALLEAACALYKMNVTVASDTATADALAATSDHTQNYTHANLGKATDLLSAAGPSQGPSVRAQLAENEAILAAIHRAIGVQTELEAAIVAGILKDADPAIALFDYHVRMSQPEAGLVGQAKALGSRLVTDQKGMQTAIEAADNVTFLARFTNLAAFVPLVKAVADASAAIKAAGTNATEAEKTALKTAQQAVRAFRFDFSEAIGAQIDRAAHATEAKALYDAFRTRLLALLGKDGISAAANVGVVAQAIYQVSGYEASAETITGEVGGADFEARLKRDAENEKQRGTTGGLYGLMPTGGLAKLVGLGASTSYAETQGAYNRLGTTSEASTGTIDETALTAMDARQTDLDAAHAKVEAERKFIADLAAKAGAAAVAAALGALTGGTSLWAKAGIAIAKALTSHGIKTAVYGTKEYDVAKALALEALSGTIELLIGGALDGSGITAEGALSDGFLKDHLFIRTAIEPYFDDVKAKLTGTLSNPVALAEIKQRGLSYLLGDIRKAFTEGIRLDKLETYATANLAKTIDILIKEGLAEAAKQTQEYFIPTPEEEDRQSLAEQLDPSDDDKALTATELAQREAESRAQLTTALQAATTSLGSEFAAYLSMKTWKKAAVGMLTTKITELAAIAQDPGAFVFGAKHAFEALGLPYQQILNSPTILGKMKALAKSPFGVKVIETATAEGISAKDAFVAMWGKLELVKTLMVLDDENCGLETDLLGDDRGTVNQVEGFIRSQPKGGGTTLSYAKYKGDLKKELGLATASYTSPEESAYAAAAASDYFAAHGLKVAYEKDAEKLADERAALSKAVKAKVEAEKKKHSKPTTTVQKREKADGAEATTGDEPVDAVLDSVLTEAVSADQGAGGGGGGAGEDGADPGLEDDLDDEASDANGHTTSVVDL